MSGPNDLKLAMLVAAIAQSPVVVGQPPRAVRPLPAGFEAVDLAVLEWIAAEGRRAGRRRTLV